MVHGRLLCTSQREGAWWWWYMLSTLELYCQVMEAKFSQ
jgi:hypothetical protein